RVENHIAVFEQFQNRRLLRRIKLEVLPLDVFQKTPEQFIAAARTGTRDQLVNCRCQDAWTIQPRRGNEKQPFTGRHTRIFDSGIVLDTSAWNVFLDWIKGVPIDRTGSLFVTDL